MCQGVKLLPLWFKKLSIFVAPFYLALLLYTMTFGATSEYVGPNMLQNSARGGLFELYFLFFLAPLYWPIASYFKIYGNKNEENQLSRALAKYIRDRRVAKEKRKKERNEYSLPSFAVSSLFLLKKGLVLVFFFV